MKVDLCFTTTKTEEGKIKVLKNLTMKEAKDFVKKHDSQIIKAYTRHFGQWHWHYTTIKGDSNQFN